MNKLSSALLVTLILPLMTFGLQCYFCDTNGVKKCKEGKLDDKLLKTCDANNIIEPETGEPLNATEIASLSKGKQTLEFGCVKGQGKIKGEGEGTIKGCVMALPGKKDDCVKMGVEGVDISACVCHKDKCNGAGGNVAGLVSLISLISFFATSYFK